MLLIILCENKRIEISPAIRTFIIKIKKYKSECIQALNKSKAVFILIDKYNEERKSINALRDINSLTFNRLKLLSKYEELVYNKNADVAIENRNCMEEIQTPNWVNQYEYISNHRHTESNNEFISLINKISWNENQSSRNIIPSVHILPAYSPSISLLKNLKI